MDAEELYQHVDSVCVPLSPTRRPEDVGRYIELDSGPLMFARFKKLFEDPQAVYERGHLIIVDGGTGFGKTSLANRCAHWLGEQLGTEGHRTVNLIESEVDENETEKRLQWVFRRAVEEAGQSVAGHTAELRALAETSVTEAFSALGRKVCVGDTSAALIVLMPPDGTAAEVRRLAAAAGRGLVFFVEMNDSVQAKECADSYGRGKTTGELTVARLTLGELNEGDGTRLVKAIHAGAASPAIPDPIIERHFEGERAKNRSVRNLMQLAYGIQYIAEENGRAEVQSEDIGDFYRLMLVSSGVNS